MSSLTEEIERQELIQKVCDKGYTWIIEGLLLNESKVYTKKGRLNKCGACRVLGCKPKELEDALEACREILKEDVDFVEE